MNKNKNPLSEDELKECRKFKACRIKHSMSQEKWASELKISHSLVKRIETGTIKCSNKTWEKVRIFMKDNESNLESPDMNSLEDHILYDIFMSHMNRIPKNDASACSAKCTRSVQSILSCMDKCESAESQKVYFQFLEQLLATLSLAAAGAVSDINEGTDVLNINHGLKSVFTKKQIKKFTDSKNVLVSADGKISYQYSLSDFYI